jgi:hypothetical protein
MIRYQAVALLLLTVSLPACSLAGRTFGTYVDDTGARFEASTSIRTPGPYT